MRIFLLFMACAGVAQAHAFLDHAEPRVGETLPGSPAAVSIWFTEDVNPAGTKIAVFDAKGTEVDAKNSTLDAANHGHMSVSLPKLAPGVYKVVWDATCPRGHHTSGHFTFAVKSEGN